MTRRKPISPVGRSVEDDDAEDYGSDPAYRAHQDRVAPYRVIADAVVLARGAQGLTQKQLATRLHTVDTAISRIESGRHPLTLDTLSKLGAVLDIAFLVGSSSAAAASSGRVVIVPAAAIAEEPEAAVVGAPPPARPARSTPTRCASVNLSRPRSAARSGR